MFEIRTTIELIGHGKVLCSEELLTGVNADGTAEDGTIGDFETMLEDVLHEFRHVFDDDEDN